QRIRLSSRTTVQQGTYPSSYDLRTLGKVSPVKDQGGSGSCWAFASISSLESSFLPGESWDFSENNLKNTHGFDLDPNYGGGNANMATAYFARWSGPVNESDDPYSDISTTSPTLPPVKHVQNVYFLPARSGPTDNDNIKYALTTWGAVYTHIYWYNSYYNPLTTAFYNPSTHSTNHAVTIIGWNDSYSRTNFATQPPGDGAFIAKNSWGALWGDQGFFYISYYDVTVGNDCVGFTGEPTSDYDREYSYDPLGWTTSMGYMGNTNADYANVFTSTSNETLKAVAFYTPAVNTAYTVSIYLDPDNGPIDTGGYATQTSGTIATPGYHTVSMPDVTLIPGEKYSVVVSATTPGYNYPVPIEYPIPGYSSHATASAGQSYVSPDGSAWTDLTSLDPNTNVCLKAFTDLNSTPVTSPPVASFSANPTSGPAPLAVRFIDTSTGSPSSWNWSFGEGSFSTVRNPSFTYATPGTYTVSLNVTNAIGSDTAVKNDYITVAIPTPTPTPTISPTPAPYTAQQPSMSMSGPASSPRIWPEYTDDGSINPMKFSDAPAKKTIVLFDSMTPVFDDTNTLTHLHCEGDICYIYPVNPDRICELSFDGIVCSDGSRLEIPV
ncbi:MAG TPA: lectin like domain-containing protein, partial [Methanoregula sp.]|nr:lectin like domain-containing protein [Methanoregula sp.]